MERESHNSVRRGRRGKKEVQMEQIVAGIELELYGGTRVVLLDGSWLKGFLRTARSVVKPS